MLAQGCLAGLTMPATGLPCWPHHGFLPPLSYPHTYLLPGCTHLPSAPHLLQAGEADMQGQVSKAEEATRKLEAELAGEGGEGQAGCMWGLPRDLGPGVLASGAGHGVQATGAGHQLTCPHPDLPAP